MSSRNKKPLKAKRRTPSSYDSSTKITAPIQAQDQPQCNTLEDLDKFLQQKNEEIAKLIDEKKQLISFFENHQK